MKSSNKLGWRAEKINYPLAICETNPETVRAPEETEAAQYEATWIVFATNEQAKGSELPKVTNASGSFNPEAPQEAAGSIVDVPGSHTEDPPLLVQPLQSISPADVTQGHEANPAQLPKVPEPILFSFPRKGPKRSRRSRGSGQLLYWFSF